MSSLKKNFAYQTAYQLLIILLPFLTSPYLSRVIGPEGLGEYSYTYSIAYYFSLFVMLGINNHGTREIAKVRDDVKKRSEKFWNLYLIQFFMGFAIIGLYIYTQIICKRDNLLSIIQLIYVISSMFDINWFFFGLEKFRVTVTRNFIVKILTVVSIFIFVQDKNDVGIYTAIMAIGFLISQLMIWPFALKELVAVKIDKKYLKSNIKPMIVLFIPVIAASIFKYMDKIMLGYLCSKRELGFYDNSEKIMAIPTGLITAIGTVMLPRITNMMKNEKNTELVMTYFKNSLVGSMMVASALAFGLAAIAPTFAPWFWGNDFSECGILITVISASILFLSWANVFRTQYLIPKNMDGVFVRATIYGAFINFIINYILIKPMGAMGTVIGTVVAEFTVAFYQAIKCRRKLQIGIYIKEIIPYVIIGFIMFCIVYMLSFIDINTTMLLLIEISVGMIIYIILSLIYLKIVKKIDAIKSLLNILNKRN